MPAQNEPQARKVSVSLYLAALLISTIIFAIGVYLGKSLEQQNLDSISSYVDRANSKAGMLELIYLMGDSPEFCPVYADELRTIDTETEQLGYKLAYMEDANGVADIGLKKKYFNLEAQAFMLSQKVREKCGANYRTVLYFYTNTANPGCPECRKQGEELLNAKKELGDKVRIYSFDGEIGSPIADALRAKYKISSYPSIVIDGNQTYSGSRGKDWLVQELRLQ